MSEVKPAMTPEEWAIEVVTIKCERGEEVFAGWRDDGAFILVMISGDEEDAPGPIGRVLEDEARTKLAAMLLEYNESGFSHGDVDTLRATAAVFGDGGVGPILSSLADRIAALLPPRETAP